ncbi:MAG: GatB/YqeY domain-containing protein [Patescibacteria group bacterium]
MTLYEQIREDMKAAMKNKDSATLDTVRMLISSIKNKAIDLGKELDDADVVATIKSDLKKLKDGLESFASAAREDLAEKAKAEITILEKYLPAQMTDGELEEKVRAKLADLGITDMASVGKAMGALMTDLKEYADGSRIKAAVDKILKK